MKTAKIYIESHKDTSLGEVITDLEIVEDDKFQVFEYDEYLNATIIVDENLNIIGGKIHPFKNNRK